MSQHAVLRGETALILRGARGFDVLRAADAQLQWLASSPYDGRVLDAILGEEGAVISTGAALVRYAIAENGSLSEVSRERRPDPQRFGLPLFTALLDSGGGPSTWVAWSSQLIPVRFGAGAPAPDIRPNTWWGVMLADIGETTPGVVTFRNVGPEEAILTDVTGSEAFSIHINDDDQLPARPGCPGPYIFPAGGYVQVRAEYTVQDAAPAEGEMSLLTNDPDSPTSTALMLVNRDTPVVGDEATNMQGITWKGDSLDLSDYLGNVVLIELIAPS